MTRQFAGCRMTAKDFQICCGMLRTLAGTASPLVPLLQQKIDAVMVVAAERLDPLVVTLNSRVEFAVDDGAAETRIVVQSEFRHGLVGLTLPITTARGLALLGVRQGQSSLFEEHGRTRSLRVRRVLYQPEARRFMREVGRWHGPAKIIDLVDARSARGAGWRPRRATSPISL